VVGCRFAFLVIGSMINSLPSQTLKMIFSLSSTVAVPGGAGSGRKKTPDQ